MLTGFPNGEKQLLALKEMLESNNIDDIKLGVQIYNGLEEYWDKIRIYNSLKDKCNKWFLSDGFNKDFSIFSIFALKHYKEKIFIESPK